MSLSAAVREFAEKAWEVDGIALKVGEETNEPSGLFPSILVYKWDVEGTLASGVEIQIYFEAWVHRWSNLSWVAPKCSGFDEPFNP